MSILFSAGSIIFYYISAALLLRRLTTGIQATQRSKLIALFFGIPAIALHLMVIYDQMLLPQGLNLSLFHVLSLTAWLISTLVVLFAFRQPVENLGIIVFPVSALTLLLQIVWGGTTGQIGIDTVGVKAHVLLSLLAFSLLNIAAIQAVLLWIQTRHLRNRHPGGFVRALPPLETMEQLLFRMIAIGYVLLTLSLLTGITFIHDIFAQHLVHKTVLTIIAWFVFALLLWGRWHYGWRGRVAVRWTLSGFAVLMLAYFGSKMVLELIL
ncbi:MAG: cytochrome c biogenesis protein CcsA [Gammaproteobacteria bacterium]